MCKVSGLRDAARAIRVLGGLGLTMTLPGITIRVRPSNDLALKVNTFEVKCAHKECLSLDVWRDMVKPDDESCQFRVRRLVLASLHSESDPDSQGAESAPVATTLSDLASSTAEDTGDDDGDEPTDGSDADEEDAAASELTHNGDSTPCDEAKQTSWIDMPPDGLSADVLPLQPVAITVVSDDAGIADTLSTDTPNDINEANHVGVGVDDRCDYTSLPSRPSIFGRLGRRELTDHLVFDGQPVACDKCKITSRRQLQLGACMDGQILCVQCKPPEGHTKKSGMIAATFTSPGKLGIKFRKGSRPPIISTIADDGPAAQMPELCSGLILVSIGAFKVHSQSYEDCLRMLKESDRPLKLQFMPLSQAAARSVDSPTDLITCGSCKQVKPTHQYTAGQIKHITKQKAKRNNGPMPVVCESCRKVQSDTQKRERERLRVNARGLHSEAESEHERLTVEAEDGEIREPEKKGLGGAAGVDGVERQNDEGSLVCTAEIPQVIHRLAALCVEMAGDGSLDFSGLFDTFYRVGPTNRGRINELAAGCGGEPIFVLKRFFKLFRLCTRHGACEIELTSLGQNVGRVELALVAEVQRLVKAKSGQIRLSELGNAVAGRLLPSAQQWVLARAGDFVLTDLSCAASVSLVAEPAAAAASSATAEEGSAGAPEALWCPWGGGFEPFLTPPLAASVRGTGSVQSDGESPNSITGPDSAEGPLMSSLQPSMQVDEDFVLAQTLQEQYEAEAVALEIAEQEEQRTFRRTTRARANAVPAMPAQSDEQLRQDEELARDLASQDEQAQRRTTRRTTRARPAARHARDHVGTAEEAFAREDEDETYFSDEDVNVRGMSSVPRAVAEALTLDDEFSYSTALTFSGDENEPMSEDLRPAARPSPSSPQSRLQTLHGVPLRTTELSGQSGQEFGPALAALGKGGAQRHRVIWDHIQGVPQPAIRHLARRGGVPVLATTTPVRKRRKKAKKEKKQRRKEKKKETRDVEERPESNAASDTLHPTWHEQRNSYHMGDDIQPGSEMWYTIEQAKAKALLMSECKGFTLQTDAVGKEGIAWFHSHITQDDIQTKDRTRRHLYVIVDRNDATVCSAIEERLELNAACSESNCQPDSSGGQDSPPRAKRPRTKDGKSKDGKSHATGDERDCDGENECSICCLKGTEIIDRVLTPCSHVFCRNCIGYWCTTADSDKNCPNCRNGLRAWARRMKFDGRQPEGYQSENGRFPEGTKVEANWGGRGTWYPGDICAVRADGSSYTYDLEYDDGDHEERVPESRIRLAHTWERATG